jgi:hypothetical protein
MKKKNKGSQEGKKNSCSQEANKLMIYSKHNGSQQANNYVLNKQINNVLNKKINKEIK